MTKRQETRSRFIRILLGATLLLTIYAVQTQAADQKTVLMLGGDHCDSYPKEITKSLMAVKGVKSVDLNSMPGHAVVVHDDSVLPKTLVEVIKGVKGNGWFCTAQIM